MKSAKRRAVLALGAAVLGLVAGLAYAQSGATVGGEASASASNDVAPLSETERAAFWGSDEDPAPEVLDATRPDLQGRHYLYSDERNLHLFAPLLMNLGGGYVGVGSDQAYLFMGWMRPSLVWLTDYDPWIKALHLVYFAFFERAETIDAFMALWDHDNEDSSRELLASVYATNPDLELILHVHDEASRVVHRRLRYLRWRMNEEHLASFVNDPETYNWVRAMVLAGRVRPMVGNLLDEHALPGAGRVARELGVPIRAIYLSNAEEYWDYTDQFRANMAGLNVDERSLVLRARASKPQNDDYCYAAQPVRNFLEWLGQSYVRRVRDVWGWCSIDGPDDIPFEVIDEPPHDR